MLRVWYNLSTFDSLPNICICFWNFCLVLEKVHLEQIIGNWFYIFFVFLNKSNCLICFTHKQIGISHLHTKYFQFIIHNKKSLSFLAWSLSIGGSSNSSYAMIKMLHLSDIRGESQVVSESKRDINSRSKQFQFALVFWLVLCQSMSLTNSPEQGSWNC